jgi:endonuclease III
MFLNCTTRKQAEKILPILFKKWPHPQDLMSCDIEELRSIIKPLGFANRRSISIIRMSKSFLFDDWKDPRDLPGIGEYAGSAYDIFCKGVLGDSPPKDKALVKYYYWRKFHEERK